MEKFLKKHIVSLLFVATLISMAVFGALFPN